MRVVINIYETKEEIMCDRRGSIGGVTVGNGWMYNNPCLRYPDNFDDMDEEEQRKSLMADDFHEELNNRD